MNRIRALSLVVLLLAPLLAAACSSGASLTYGSMTPAPDAWVAVLSALATHVAPMPPAPEQTGSGPATPAARTVFVPLTGMQSSDRAATPEPSLSAPQDRASRAADPGGVDISTAQPTAVAENDILTADQLRNTQYRSEFTSSGEARLVDGVFEQSSSPATKSGVAIALGDEFGFGDLNDDGRLDAVATLDTNLGGNAVYVELVAVLNKGGQPAEADSVFLGDSVKVYTLAVDDGTVTVHLLAHGPLDAVCCPTQQITRQFKLEGARMIEVEPSPPPLAAGLVPSFGGLRDGKYSNQFAATGTISLTEGAYAEPQGTGTQGSLRVALSELHAFGDLNGDSSLDVAVVLVSEPTTGGSFYDLHALVANGDQLVEAASASLGDRIKLRFVSIDGGVISVGVVKHAPVDPQESPTVSAVLKYRLNGGKLAPVD